MIGHTGVRGFPGVSPVETLGSTEFTEVRVERPVGEELRFTGQDPTPFGLTIDD